jgi:4-amino-4-deoxy-L-arabinose transferase-like glycosyltransferase
VAFRWNRALLRDGRLPLTLFVVTRAAYLLDVASSDAVLRNFTTLDSERFLKAGELIASGALLGGPEPFEFAPLYAYFLAMFSWLGLGVWAVYAILVALGGLSTWLVLKLGRRLLGQTSGVIGACLWVLYGAAGMLELKIMDTTLSTTLLLGALWLATRPTVAASVRGQAGVLLGLASLARPNALVLLPITAYWMMSRTTWRWRSRGVGSRYAVALLIGAGLAIAPITLRNRLVTGAWTLVSNQGGVAFYQGNNPASQGTYARPLGFSGEPMQQGPEARAIADAAEGRRLTPSEVDRYWYRRGISFLGEDAGHALALWAKKCALWFGSAELSVEYVLLAERELFPTLWLMPLPFAVLLGGAALGLSRRAFVGKRGLLVAWLLMNLLTTIVFFFASRYRVPAVPLLCLLAGDGLAQHLRTVRRKRRGQSLGRTNRVGAVAVTVASLVPLSGDEARQQASYFFLLGNGYFAAHAPEIAIHHFERAAAGNPNSWKIRHNLGEAYGSVGRYGAAVVELTFAARLDPKAASTQRALLYYRSALSKTGPSR